MSRNKQNHLTEEELLSFVTDELSEDSEEEVDQHLEFCEECKQVLEDFYNAQEHFPEAAWGARRESFVAELRQRVFGTPPVFAAKRPGAFPISPLHHLAAHLREAVLFTRTSLRRLTGEPDLVAGFASPAMAATPWVDGQTEDGVLRWRIVEDEEDNLIVRFASHKIELEGMRLRLYAGDWQREFELRKVESDQVGAETIITREERELMPADVLLRVEPADDAEDVTHADR